MRKQSVATSLLALTMWVGCDGKQGATAPPPMMAVSASPADAPVPTSLAIRTVGSLPSGRPTMLAAMPGGSVFALQHDSAGGSTSVLELKPGGSTPRPIALTAALVLDSLGFGKTAGADGSFSAIAPCADGRLAFSFAGTAGAKPFAAVGTYAPASNALFVSIDSSTLAGVDPELATDVGRPSLFTVGDDAWLWRTAGNEVRLLTIEGLSNPRPKLGASRISLEQVKDVVARSAWDWSATPTRGEFLLTDTASRWIRRVDARGTIVHIARFDETIATISPAAQDAAGRIVVLGNDRDGVAICALIQDGEAFKAISRENFDIAGISKDKPLRFDRLYPVPGERNAYVSYEATSGSIVTITLK